jgi:hypothetical protein
VGREVGQDGKPYRRREAAGAEPLHHPGAVHFDGTYADPEIVGDHFAGPAGDEAIQHLALAWTESADALGRLRRLAVCGPPPRVCQRGLYRGESAFVVERLFNKVDRTSLHRCDSGRYITVAGNHDNRQIKPELGELALHSEAINFRHLDIEQYASR